MTHEELLKVIENHQHFLKCDIDGWENMRACLNNEYLSSLKLLNVDLSYASLRFANLSSSELTNVDLHHADLTGTNLSNSTIDSCDLRGN